MISIHAPAWGATPIPSSLPSRWRFQSTHPRGVRRGRPRGDHPRGGHFNPRTRVGCDRPSSPARASAYYFNPRTRVGCDFSGQAARSAAFGFQSTHPRGVRPRLSYLSISALNISIHAPAWGATLIMTVAKIERAISIHAPAWGATTYSVILLLIKHISIHAPAWGATFATYTGGNVMEFQSTHPRGVRLFLSIFLFAYTDFNPRTRVGCDGVNDYATKPSTYFNPRTRVGCDLNNGGKKLCHINFNPRTRVGCDQRKRGPSVRHHVISIHAPAWGATVALIKGITGSLDFNPRTRVGCDLQEPSIFPHARNFNPRTRVGCD